MELPVYIDGRAEGGVSIAKQSAHLLLTVRMRPIGRVARLYLYGDGEPFYLGIPVPEGDELRLMRRLTPTQARAIPAEPSYAAEKPMREEKPRHRLRFGGRSYYF